MSATVSFHDWNKEIDMAYSKHLEGVDRHDRAAFNAAMQPIIDELAVFEGEEGETTKVQSALSRVRRCKEQFVNMVSMSVTAPYFYILTYGIRLRLTTTSKTFMLEASSSTLDPTPAPKCILCSSQDLTRWPILRK